MKRSKRLLFMSIAFMMILTLFPTFLMRVYADAEPKKLADQIFANGVPITIEEGSNPSLTKIKYGDNKYLDFGGGVYELDLSDIDVFGGSEDEDVNSSSITMTGGSVRLLLGGGRLGKNVNGDVTINISGDAKVSTLYGGGDSNSSVNGKVTINISGGTVKNKFLVPVQKIVPFRKYP